MGQIVYRRPVHKILGHDSLRTTLKFCSQDVLRSKQISQSPLKFVIRITKAFLVKLQVSFCIFRNLIWNPRSSDSVRAAHSLKALPPHYHYELNAFPIRLNVPGICSSLTLNLARILCNRQTVGDIRRFIAASRPDIPSSYRLLTAFPQAQLTDDSATIEGAGLQNAVIIQKLN